MLTAEDDSMLEDFEKVELENPAPKKIIDEKWSI